MTDLSPMARRPGAVVEPVDFVRGALFCVALIVVWFSLDPFASLGESEAFDLAGGREGATYAVFALLAAGAAALVVLTQPAALRALMTPWMFALGLWLVFSVAASQDMGTSMRRFALFAMAATVAASLMLLPSGKRQLAALLALVAGLLIGLSYFGVAVIPTRAVHQASDAVEPLLAGDWRGVFGHKNVAGAVFAMVTFIGVFIARAGYRGPGIAIAVLAGLFVLLSGSKSSTLLLFTTLAISGFVSSASSTTLRFLAVVGPLAVLFAVGPGAVLSDRIAAFVSALPVDLTFTGRTDVWELAFEKIAERPWTGYGFSAFWTLESTKFGSEDIEAWAGDASHAHNGYIDAVLNIGVPGLVLTLMVILVQPFRDFVSARRAGADPALTMMLFQIWCFGVLLSVMESFIYVRADPIWVTFLFAVFGLRYMAAFVKVKA